MTTSTFEEMMNEHSVWVAKDPKYGKTGVCRKCGKLHHEGKWQIISNKDIYRIYTTDLEMPQCSPNMFEASDFTNPNPDELYFLETMIQNMQDGSWLGFQARYKTRDEAILGHWLAYDKLEDMILSPEKYPQGIMEIFFQGIKQAQYAKDKLTEETKKLST